MTAFTWRTAAFLVLLIELVAPVNAQNLPRGAALSIGDVVGTLPREKLLQELRARTRGEDAPQAELARATLGLIVEELRIREKTLYGSDNRKDYWELTPALRIASDSTVALFKRQSLTPYGDNYVLPNTPLRTLKNLCDGQVFAAQPAGSAECSGFLAADGQIVTAGHCIMDINVKEYAAVFGYRMDSHNVARVVVPKSDVFFTDQIVKRSNSTLSDFAVIDLDRSTQPRKPLTIRVDNKVTDQAPVYVIGYPTGLPVKYAAGATVLDNTPLSAFVANVDTFAGNSGSPVLGPQDLVEGILVAGSKDYVSIPQGTTGASCNVAFQCTKSECRGEIITRSTEFSRYIAPLVAK